MLVPSDTARRSPGRSTGGGSRTDGMFLLWGTARGRACRSRQVVGGRARGRRQARSLLLQIGHWHSVSSVRLPRLYRRGVSSRIASRPRGDVESRSVRYGSRAPNVSEIILSSDRQAARVFSIGDSGMHAWHQPRIRLLTPGKLWLLVIGRMSIPFGLGGIAMRWLPELVGPVGWLATAVGLVLLPLPRRRGWRGA